MTVAAEGMFSQPLNGLAVLLADLEAWQGWCGVAAELIGTPAGAAAAGGHVHLIAHEEDPEASIEDLREGRPHAIVGFTGEFSAEKVTEPPTYEHDGTLELVVADFDRHAGERDNLVDFANRLGSVLAELETVTGADGHLLVTGYRLLEGPARPTAERTAAGELPEVGAVLALDWREA